MGKKNIYKQNLLFKVLKIKNLQFRLKYFILTTLILLNFVNAFCFEADDIRFLTFENGLKMYLIEDSSSALVKMELRINAGYSSQTEKTTGYFPLYARLKNVTISADCVSKSLTCAPGEAEKSIQELSELLEPLKISDKALKAEINTERTNTTHYANDLAGFINSSIESRVFYDSPWKRESSTNPQVFTQNSLNESRSILNSIANEYYTPENAILYVSGNITANAAETFTARYFNRFSNPKTKLQKSNIESKIISAYESKKLNKQKRFILTNDSFSDDMTQVVVQYTGLQQFESDIAATTMNEDFSEFKESLTIEKMLGIRGAEYINISSIQKRNSSRLIIQSLLEKTKSTPIEQVKKFLSKLNNSFFSQKAFDYEISQYSSEFIKRRDSSNEIMSILADWTSIRNETNSQITLFNRIDELKKINADVLSKKILNESPYIFILMNTKNYEKYKKDFDNLSFQQVTSKNGAWFKQDFYLSLIKTNNSKANKIVKDQIQTQSEEETYESAKRFVEKNIKEFSKFTLNNGIPVIIKKTNTNTASLSITIEGGDMEFAQNAPGLTTVIIDAIAYNIRNQLDLLHYNGATKGIYNVTAKTDSTYSIINITFSSDEFIQTINAVTGALIYGEISPAIADGICYDERTQWRLKTGTSESQMLFYAIRKMYEKKNIELLYDDSKDRPKQLSYSEILESYPYLIDSSRYSLVIAGNFETNDDFTKNLDETFGLLRTNKFTKVSKVNIEEPNFTQFESKPLEKRIQLKHLFLTDVTADKAGPRPAVLIPTTKFLDPILYIQKSPSISSNEIALFNAILLELGKRIEKKAKKIESTTNVKISPAEKDLPFARIFISNADRTNFIDKAFKEAISELKTDLAKIINDETEITKFIETEVVEVDNDSEDNNQQKKTIEKEIEKTNVKLVDLEKNEIISRMENQWIMANLSETGTAQGTTALIQKGYAFGKPNLYLEQYSAIDNATAADYYLILSKYIKNLPTIRIYSADSRR